MSISGEDLIIEGLSADNDATRRANFVARMAVRGAYADILGIPDEARHSHSDDELRELVLDKFTKEEGKI